MRRGRALLSSNRNSAKIYVGGWKRNVRQLCDLIEAILRDPFNGIGKPEPLKGLGANVWSRRLTQEHRIVYLLREDQIDFLQARYHY